jgi:hypothetical protein
MSFEGRLIFAGRALRTFAFGFLSLVLALNLERRGLSAWAIGAVFTATLVEDAVATALIASFAQRLGRRRVLIASAWVMVLAGLGLAFASHPLMLVVAAIFGTLSPSGQEAGPFSPLEQALLPATAPASARTRVFAWYNVFGYVPAALGALFAGGWLGFASRHGTEAGQAEHGLLLLYTALGALLACVYWLLPRALDAPDASNSASPRRWGLGRSRAVVLQLAALQGLDALAGGFIVQSLLVYWFARRFGVGAETLGPLFFGTNLLSALSFLAAARVAARFGLLNTMVFSHLPSNVLLLLVPLAPGFQLAAGLLLARHLLSQMDVPTRQAYAMTLVAAEERPAAAGITTSVRALAQALAPAFTGLALKTAASGLPFFLAGGLKIAYDIALYFRFRNVALPERL